MPRPIWKGHLTFGLVVIPVTLYSAESPHNETNFTMLDSRDQSRIRYTRISEATGKEVPWKSIVKGVELDNGKMVVLNPEDFKKASLSAAKNVTITDFVGRDEIPPRYFEKPYFLEPAAGAERVYVLLRETLRRADRIGIASVVIHSRQYLAALLVDGPALMLNTMRFADELRSPDDLKLPAGTAAHHKVTTREIEMAEQLIEGMTASWEPKRYHDEYRESLKRWIDARSKNAAAKPEPEEEELPPTYNIMDMLKKSVEQQHRPLPHRRRAPASAPARRTRKAG